MKKVLLVAVIALVTLSASAGSHPTLKRLGLANEKKLEVTTSKNKVLEAAYQAKKAEQDANKAIQVNSIRRAGEEELELIPAYSEWTYSYFNYGENRGFIPQIMYDGASYLVDGEKAYFAPFYKLGYVEGVRVGTQNFDTETGDVVTADVYEFTSAIIGKTTSGIELSLEPCDIVDFVAIRSGKGTFNAYYFTENGEFYIPSDVCLALFDANSASTEVFNDAYVARMLDLLPQDLFNQYISKGTYSAKTYYSSRTDISGDCEIFVGYEDVYYVKGADGIDAWVEYDIDESDMSYATVFENQCLGHFMFSNDGVNFDLPGVITTVGLLQSGGSLTAFNAANDYISAYKITDNADGTTTIANTDNTVYGLYIFAADGDDGMYNAFDMNITITYEPAYPDAGGDDGGDDTAIKGVKSEKVNTNGTYNLNGQRVNDNAKGLIIKDGKKFIVK